MWSARRGGTMGNGVASGTLIPTRDDSCNDGVCDLTGGSCRSINASGDTRAEPWHDATPTHGWEGGVMGDGDGADEVDGEVEGAFGKTCLMESGADALKVDAA